MKSGPSGTSFGLRPSRRAHIISAPSGSCRPPSGFVRYNVGGPFDSGVGCAGSSGFMSFVRGLVGMGCLSGRVRSFRCCGLLGFRLCGVFGIS